MNTKIILEDIQALYPTASLSEIKRVVKYQDKFSITYDNIKCINPDCNNMKRWSGDSNTGFNQCCSKECRDIMSPVIKKNMINKMLTKVSNKTTSNSGINLSNYFSVNHKGINYLTSWLLELDVTSLSIRSNGYDIIYKDKMVAIDIISFNNDSLDAKNFRSERLLYKHKHAKRSDECLSKNIKLFMIYENELNMDNIETISIWQSMIKNGLGLSTAIYARKCEVIELIPKNGFPTKLSVDFTKNNHIQSSANASYRFGLFYNKELVAVMTFGVSRFNKNIDYELIRYCNLKYYNVVGGASRLLKAFRQAYPGSIISYANRRWSEGNLYRQLGFKEETVAEPNYFYWHEDDNSIKTDSRQSFQKHKLEKKLKVFDPEQTEMDNTIKLNGYRAIYDAGNFVFTLK
jgi:hypothetical protein